jgi:hypothetical protein
MRKIPFTLPIPSNFFHATPRHRNANPEDLAFDFRRVVASSRETDFDHGTAWKKIVWQICGSVFP